MYHQFGGSMMRARVGGLMGVFLTGSPSSPPNPPQLTDETATPGLQRGFYIGVGLLRLVIPPQATRLFFGFRDSSRWSSSVGAVAVTVTERSWCDPDDADGDGDVDNDDLSLLLANWGSETATCNEGEFSGVPPVDDDLSLLPANWTGSLAAVPEPATFGLIALSGLALILEKADI